MVFTTALRLVADAAEAEDISQDVFLKAFQHFADLRANPAAGGWLKRVATNLSLNHLSRYRSRWRFFSEFSSNRDDDAEAEPDFPAPQDIESDLDLADRHQLVEAALQKLPAAQRVPLVLYHLNGFSYEEIAARLKVSLGKVKTDIFRGREALRRKLHLKLGEALEDGMGTATPANSQNEQGRGPHPGAPSVSARASGITGMMT
jgi:RNA polymerase sigma-70 factor (ECF subfamily)